MDGSSRLLSKFETATRLDFGFVRAKTEDEISLMLPIPYCVY